MTVIATKASGIDLRYQYLYILPNTSSPTIRKFQIVEQCLAVGDITTAGSN
jgi:hypothetical protein